MTEAEAEALVTETIAVQDQEYLTECATAKTLNVSVGTLRRWHRLRCGPPKTKLGKQNFYRLESLRSFMLSREQAQPQRGMRWPVREHRRSRRAR